MLIELSDSLRHNGEMIICTRCRHKMLGEFSKRELRDKGIDLSKPYKIHQEPDSFRITIQQ